MKESKEESKPVPPIGDVYTVSTVALKYKSHGITAGSKVYLGSAFTQGIALSDLECTSAGAPAKLRIAHSWSDDKIPIWILWLVMPTDTALMCSADDWRCPALKSLKRRLTFHPIPVLGFDWLTRYVSVLLSVIGPLSVEITRVAADRASRGFLTLSEPPKPKQQWQLLGSPSSTAPRTPESPYQSLQVALRGLEREEEFMNRLNHGCPSAVDEMDSKTEDIDE